MKTKSTIAVALALAMGMSCMFAACKPEEGKQEGLTDKALSGSMLADYSKGDPGAKVQFPSDGWTNGDPFNARWTASQVTFSEGQAHLAISENPAENKPVGEGYLGGELRTSYYYGFGDYEVRMKPSTSAGTASTFFVCTGNYDVWPDGTQNPWDEIDIEFLGKDTTEVQFNYFANGQGGHEYMYKLGFDASKEFHNYGFRWAESYITWFVDGKPVYRIDKKTGEDFPKTAGRILMNYWSGTETSVGWMGKFAGPDGKTADYEWVKTSAEKVNPPTGDPYPDKPDTPTPPAGETLDWSKIEALELGFASAEEYTVTPAADKKSAGITYTGVTTNYHNIEMDVTESAAGKNAAHLKIKNNGTAPVNVRFNLVNDEQLAAGAQNSAVNKSATQDGVTVRTDLEWGGSYFDLEGGKEAECVVLYEGVANKLQLMIDSAIYGNNDAKSGDLTVSELKFGNAGDEGGETPDLPEANNKGVTVNGSKLAVTGNTDDYIVISDETANTLRVVYADLAGATYKNLWMDASAIARTKNVFTVKVTNNGSDKLTFRVDIESVTAHGDNNIVACNQSAKQDGADVWTDLAWGGSKFEIEAGKTAVCTVTYDTSMGPTNVKMYFDSCINEDTAKHSGDVLLSEMAFSGEGSYTPAEPTPTPTPSGDPVALTFNAEANSGYTMTAGEENKSWTLGYVGKGNTYNPVTAACAELAAGKNTFTIKNNKDTAVTVRVDVQGTTRVDTSNNDGSGSGTDCTNVSATCTGGTGLYTDTTWGGTKVTLAAGEEVTLTITYDATMAQGAVKNILIFVDSMGGDENDHDASVTVSGFLFTGKQN